MTTPLNETATLRDLLFADTRGAAADTLAGALHDLGTVKPFLLVGPALTVAEHEVASATDELLSLSLVDILASGWKKYDALKQAARRTSAAPGTEEVVVLATHRIDSTHSPAVELYVDGTSMGTIELMMCVSLTVAGVRAVVREGRLTEIRTGTCTAAGSLTVAGIEVVKKQGVLDLPGAVRLHGGIALLDAAPSAVAAPS